MRKWFYRLDTEKFLKEKRRSIDKLVEDESRLIFSYRGNKNEGFILPKTVKVVSGSTQGKKIGDYMPRTEFNTLVPAYHRKYYSIEEIVND